MTLKTRTATTTTTGTTDLCRARTRRTQICGLVGALALCAGGVALGADALLEHYDTSITTYKASATSVQGAQPLHDQRGVNLDGTSRSGNGWGWMLNGNTSGEPIAGSVSVGSVRLDTGTWQSSSVDLSLPAWVPWHVGRTYNLRGAASDGYQGARWFQSSQPEIVLWEGATDDLDLLYLVYGADRYVAFKRQGATPATTAHDTFKGINGAAGVVVFDDSGTMDTYTLHTLDGWEVTFFGFDGDASPAGGQLWKIENADGDQAYVGHASTDTTAISDGYDSSGRLEVAYDSSERRYTYTYSTLNSVVRLTQVVAETKTGATWASPGTVTEVGKVEYGYYGSGQSAGTTYGSTGDLALVTRTTPLSDAAESSVRKTYYRYWSGTWNASTNPGHDHAIQYILEAEGYRQADWADANFNDTPLTTGETSLKPYAAAYFEYDGVSTKRVNAAWFNGKCGCSGASNGEHTFAYTDNGSHSATSGYDSDWKTQTVVAKPDGSYITSYVDEVGQRLSSVTSDIDPSSSSPTPDYWVSQVTRNSDGMVTEVATPEANASYTHSTGAFTQNASDGLIRTFGRFSTSDSYDDFVEHVKYKIGSGGSQYYLSSTSAVGDSSNNRKETIGSVTLARFNSNKQTQYTEAYTSTASATDATKLVSESDVVNVHSGKPLMVEEALGKAEFIPTGENGDGTTQPKSYSWPDKSGRVTWTRDATGLYTATLFTDDGQPHKVTVDPDQAMGIGDPLPAEPDIGTGFNLPASGGLRLTTEYTYDAQGRRETVDAPDGTVSQSHVTRLSDHRLVSIVVPRVVSGTTFHGPAHFSVTNFAGQVEASGMIYFSGGSTTTAIGSWIDTTDSDIKAALDTGSLFRLTTNVYNDSGSSLEESRMYFDIPSSLPGTEGTNYDATTYGYDDMGRRWRVKSPTGTISRSVFDDIGRQIESWVGTNDNSFSGGEASGTDDMVKVSEIVYDAGGVGNGLVTKVTAFVEDSTTDRRDTEYKYDDRGRRIVTLNPEAPHTLVKLDNLGRTTAVGQYKASAGLDASDDPISLQTNRIALSRSLYDQQGRVYETRTYKVDPSNGAYLETTRLTSSRWYDDAGRVIKETGPRVTKTSYDTLGRVDKRYVIGVLDDTTYAHAQDVAGDKVLEQTETTYEDDTGLVLWSVNLARYYSDTTSTGELTADTDARPMYTAHWYDDDKRREATAIYGDNNGTAFSRPGTAPSSSDTILVTSTSYNDDGTVKEITDPAGTKTRTDYDDAGRTIATIANYSSHSTPLTTATRDENLYTRFTYVDGQRTELWIDTDGDDTQDSDDPVTEYIYGVVKGTSAGESNFASEDLLYRVKHPDSTSDTDSMTYAYNAQRQIIWTKDQAGNIIEQDYKDDARLEHQRVTTLASGFNGDVRRISHTYNGLGQRTEVTQYDNATVGSGSVTDEVHYEYDDWGPVSSIYEDVNSAVNTSTGDHLRWDIVYAHANNDWEAIRTSYVAAYNANTLKSLTIYGYGTGIDSEVSRVQSVINSTTAATYEYNGVGQLVGMDLPQPDVFKHLDPAGDDSYSRTDRFGRVVEDVWTKDLATDIDFYDISISYDRLSNITLIEDNIYTGWDSAYAYDDVDRLTDNDRGTWNGSSITTRVFREQWDEMDQRGNFTSATRDRNGDGSLTGTGDRDDTNTFNLANEWTDRDNGNGPDNDNLVCDAVGNITKLGDGPSAADGHEYTYDAFGRLVKVEYDDGTMTKTIAEYRYNGLNQLISRLVDTDGDGDADSSDVWIHHLYDHKWRIVATVRDAGTPSSPNIDSDFKETFVYHEAGLGGNGGSSYIDDVILRDKDANTSWASAADSTREERLYYCQNFRHDVVQTLTSSGTRAEKVRYSAYGIPFGSPVGDVDFSGSVSAFEPTYGGYDVREDFNLDGVEDSKDSAMVNVGQTLGWNALSRANGTTGAYNGNRKGYAGYESSFFDHSTMHVRHRVYLAELGRWSRRDPIGYADGPNMYAYVSDQPIYHVDPSGQIGVCGSGSPTSWVPDLPTWGAKGLCYICAPGPMGMGGFCCGFFPCEGDGIGPGAVPSPAPGPGGPPAPPPPPPAPHPCDAFFPGGGVPGIPTPAPGNSCNVWSQCRFAPGYSGAVTDPRCVEAARQAAKAACASGAGFVASLNAGLRAGMTCQSTINIRKQCFQTCINNSVAPGGTCNLFCRGCAWATSPNALAGCVALCGVTAIPGLNQRFRPCVALCLKAHLVIATGACVSCSYCLLSSIVFCADGCGY